MKDLLLPNAVNQNDEKQHTAGLNDTAIPHVKIKITEIPREKKVNTYRSTGSPHVPLVIIFLLTSAKVLNCLF